MAVLHRSGKVMLALVSLSFQVSILCLAAVPLLSANPVAEDAFAPRRQGQRPGKARLAGIGPFSERRSESERREGSAYSVAISRKDESHDFAPDDVLAGRSVWTRENSDGPVAKAWPEEFSINYTTNYGAASGFLAYDWGKKRQIMYHGPKSPFCAAYGTDDPCQVFEYPGGTYVYIPSLGACSLTNGAVGSVPPDWTTNSAYIGVEEIPGIGLCRAYGFPPTAHVWYETLTGSLPCMFVFPDPSLSFYFDPDSLDLGTPDEKYFDVPGSCLNGQQLLSRTSAM